VSTNTGLPLVLENGSKAGEAFRRIAMRLNGQSNLPIQVPQGPKGFWKKFGLKLGRKR
jgi:septum site-determining protein MinD